MYLALILAVPPTPPQYDLCCAYSEKQHMVTEEYEDQQLPTFTLCP